MQTLPLALLHSISFVPHGHCYLWNPGLVSLHLVADIVTAIAYYSIPLTLIYFVQKRQDLPFNSIFLLFSFFITACGTTHLMDVWTIWYPTYWLSGTIKALTAIISTYTAVILVFLLPEALVLPGLATINKKLETEIVERQKTETALRESEERFRSTFEQAAVGMAHVSLDGRFIRLNQRFCEITGYLPSELENLTFQAITHADDLEADLEQTQNLIAGKIQTYAMEKRYIRKDGSIVWINLTSSLVRDRSGTPKYFIAVIEDITTRKQAEEELRQTERLRMELQLLENILENSMAGYWDWDIPGNREYLSPTFKRMLGYTDDELPNHPESWQRLIFAEDLLGVLACFEQHVKSRGDIPYYNEVRYHHKNGSTIWVICSGRVIEWDQEGQPLRMIGSHIDITERKKTEEALKESEERWHLALRGSNDGIWDWNIKTDQAFFSTRWKEMRGFSDAEISENLEEWSDRIHPVDRDRVIATLNDHLTQKTPFYQAEYRVRRQDRTYMWVLDRGQALWDENGNAIRMTGSETDITERKVAEEKLLRINMQLVQTNIELARATRLKDEFLANMSHELRTPLNAILGMSEGLQEGVFGDINERQTMAIATIERSGRHLLDLINDILDLSKIEAGKFELQLSQVPINSLCDASLALVRQMASKKNIKLNIHIAQNLGSIQADDRRLRQVLINLLSNAVKFTPEGGLITLEVWLEQSHLPYNFCFAVSDTGIGIAPENIDRLFQPFIQLDSSLNRQYSGTGLGLALVKQITALHGGTVSVSSQVGQGSCFTVRIPCQYSVPAAVSTWTAQLPNSCLPIANPQVLVIEDSTPAAEQLTRYLQEMGMQPVIYAQGEGAIAEVLRVRPGFIILDLQLPNLSGWDVLTQLKANPQTRDVPVLIISVVDERAKGLALGAFEYLVKPITRTQLQAALEKLQCSIQTNSPASTEISQPVPESPLILLVEDNQANIDTMSGYLGSRGYRLALARNGQEAIDWIKTQLPDLIVMDIQMPVMDGLAAMQHIRTELQLIDIPIIVLTAFAMSGDRKTCLAAGANEYLAKPVKLKQLVITIQSLLKSKKN